MLAAAAPSPAASAAARRTHIVAQCASHGVPQHQAQQRQQRQQQQGAGSRRAVLGLGAALLAARIAPARADEPLGIAAETEAPAPLPQQPALPPMKVLRDETLAYTFEYPAETAAGKPLPLLLSRKPERYSSAAPLTADARQRIVCELADLIDAVTVSVTVGPPSGILKGRTPDQWTARQVAEQVLIDRSTARITTGQRVSLNSVEEASRQDRDGVPYFAFEHVSQGSPTLRTATQETYRHALAVTAVRPGLDGSPYLYTLNMSCPQELWGDLQAAFQRGVDSFTLLPPTDRYVAPDQDPWRFF